jgi:hypothetical protein
MMSIAALAAFFLRIVLAVGMIAVEMIVDVAGLAL